METSPSYSVDVAESTTTVLTYSTSGVIRNLERGTIHLLLLLCLHPFPPFPSLPLDVEPLKPS